jgi:hypothetical protein
MGEIVVATELRVISFEGRSITWAGENPLNNRLVFCDDEGYINHTDREGNNPTRDKVPVTDLINGLAFCLAPRAIAISTKSELIVSELPGKDQDSPTAIIPLGAHGVVASRVAGFITARGTSGGELIRPESTGRFLRRSFKAGDRELYFYKIVSVGVSSSADEVLACAARRDGLISVVIDANGKPGNLGRAAVASASEDAEASFDIVDACPVPTAGLPYAVVALAIDGSLHFTRDIRTENPSVGLRLREVSGTAYSLHCIQGHLVLLTSDTLCILPGMAARLASGEPLPERAPILRRPTEAMDCFVAYDRYVLLAVDGGAEILDIERILPSPQQGVPDPAWSAASGFTHSPEELTAEPIPAPWESSHSPPHLLDPAAVS